MNSNLLIGPFAQILTMSLLPTDGPVPDSALEVRANSWVMVEDGKIEGVGFFDELHRPKIRVVKNENPQVLIPGFIDAHTHICFAGSRADEYTKRLTGKAGKRNHDELFPIGGGILNTVKATRAATKEQLVKLLKERVDEAMRRGVTTCEVKSGYGLTIDDEIKQLSAIAEVNERGPIDLISTCLAAHSLPPEFTSAAEYLKFLSTTLLPIVKEKGLSKRVDIYVDEGAFTAAEAKPYLKAAQEQGFSITVHADQFKKGGAHLAAQLKAVSADHLEVSDNKEFKALKAAEVIPVVLPGASLGLGVEFARAREILDDGLPLVIASDWNPGSAPMGNLLTQAAILGTAQNLTAAETLAALTIRAARALQIVDKGRIAPGFLADMIAFPCTDWREILYQQGSMLPSQVYTHRSLKHGLV